MSSVAATGLGLGASLAAAVAEILIVGLRFINFGLINLRIKVFLVIVSYLQY